MTIQEYIRAVDEQFQTGVAHEHAYRPALQQLLDEMLPNYTVTNEPSRYQCGAPDYLISQSKGAQQPVFFVEAKDLFDSDLDGMRQHKEQFNRYKSSLDYIIFTDYLDFHVYEHGEWVKNVRIGELQGTHIRLVKSAVDDFTAIINHLADSKPQPIISAARLAQQMASKARLLADVITQAFNNAKDENDENFHDNSQLQGELEAFRNVLIHDLTEEAFADIYAQTVAYGMFAARLHDDTPEDFSRQEAAMLIPKTNPFLRQIFQQIAGYDLDNRIAWIVDDLAQTFLVTNVDKVMKTYGGNSLHNDPMIHFYEDFLSAYNPALRKSKGVWYTPQPVVRFIVRAVDDILKRDFQLPMGLADYSKIEHEVVNDHWGEKDKKSEKTIKKSLHRVQILDPATGTGTFLAEVVRHIYGNFQDMQGMWQSYVEEHLLPRLHGFELLMASYAVAHLKLDMQLRSMGYDSAKSQKRLGVYLTNSLEECDPDTGTLWSQWLSNEAREANFIKRDCPVMVMVGNPPYSISSSNKGKWITQLVDDYKQNLNERNIQPLSDDYIKFIRLGQHYVENNGQGILAYISNNSFIDGIIHREMRHQLLLAFDDIYIVNLHGNTRKKEVAPDGGKDENVFDIMQGVSINIFVRKPEHQDGSLGRVFYKDLYGRRESKYEYLDAHSIVDSIDWEEISIAEPNYFFVPKDFGVQEEYERGIKVDALFIKYKNGIETGMDDFFCDINIYALKSKIREAFANKNDAIKRFNIHNTSSFRLEDNFNTATFSDKYIVSEWYRPLDSMAIYYDDKMQRRPSYDVLQNMLKDNIALITSPQGQAIGGDIWNGVSVSDKIVDRNIFRRGGGLVFPLYLYTTAIDGTEERVPNLNREEWQRFADAVGRDVTPEELLHYIYGMLHSPSYRERYKEFLKIDFPRIPLPVNDNEFKRYAGYGSQLIDLHLMKNTSSWQIATTFPEAGNCEVTEIRYADERVYINKKQYFGNVSATAWNAYIGGYQPAQKWLKDRKSRALTFDDIRHYMHIIHALSEAERIMTEIG